MVSAPNIFAPGGLCFSNKKPSFPTRKLGFRPQKDGPPEIYAPRAEIVKIYGFHPSFETSIPQLIKGKDSNFIQKSPGAHITRATSLFLAGLGAFLPEKMFLDRECIIRPERICLGRKPWLFWIILIDFDYEMILIL